MSAKSKILPKQAKPVAKSGSTRAAKEPPAPVEKVPKVKRERKLVYGLNASDIPFSRLKEVKFVMVSNSIEKSKKLDQNGQPTDYLLMKVHGYLPEEDPTLARPIFFKIQTAKFRGWNEEYDDFSMKIDTRTKEPEKPEAEDAPAEYLDPESGEIYDQLSAFRANLASFLANNIEVLNKIMSTVFETTDARGKVKPVNMKERLRIINKGLTRFPRKGKNPKPDDPHYFGVRANFINLVAVDVNGGNTEKVNKEDLQDCSIIMSVRMGLDPLRGISNGAIGVGFTASSGVIEKVDALTQTIHQADDVERLREKANNGQGFDVLGTLKEIAKTREAQSQASNDEALDEVFVGETNDEENEEDEEYE